MEALKFSQIEYLGAFAFASGLAVVFVSLYVTSMKSRVKDLIESSESRIKASSAREKESINMQVELVKTIQQQASVIDRFMQLEETVTDLRRRVIKLEP